MDDQEHPAFNAAREIKQLHLDNIKMIDDGFVFHDKDGKSVNDEMRAACEKQIILCDEIMNTGRSLPPELLGPVELMLADARATIDKALDDAILPEIGNYDNDEKS